MTITRSVDQEKQLTVLTVDGEPSFDDFMTTLRSIYEKCPTKNLLWDFRNVTSSEFLFTKDFEFFVDWTKECAEVRRGGKTAWVFSRSVDYGMGTMTLAFSEIEQLPLEIKVFYSMEEATQWLEKKD